MCSSEMIGFEGFWDVSSSPCTREVVFSWSVCIYSWMFLWMPRIPVKKEKEKTAQTRQKHHGCGSCVATGSKGNELCWGKVRAIFGVQARPSEPGSPLPAPDLHFSLWIQEFLWRLVRVTGGLNDLSTSQDLSHCKCRNTSQTGQGKKVNIAPDLEIKWAIGVSESRGSNAVDCGPSISCLCFPLGWFYSQETDPLVETTGFSAAPSSCLFSLTTLLSQ